MHNAYNAECILYIDGYKCVDRIYMEKGKWKQKQMNTDSLFQKHNNMYAERTHFVLWHVAPPILSSTISKQGEKNLPIFNNQGKAIGDVCWCLV